MSSKKSSKLDLLVRVRFSNPLPPPPCPPKLLNIPTNPLRYAQPDYLSAIVDQQPLPMIIDEECGMPLNLGNWECLWEEGADDSALNPDPSNLPPVDPEDAFLLADPSSSTGAYSANGSQNAASSTPAPAHVSWLRRPEYGRDGVTKAVGQDAKHAVAAPVDISRPAQLAIIEESFAAANENFDLESLQHPTKRHLKAVESYPILPDPDIWANQYDLFRFSERPGERPPDVEDPRLDCAILRPMKTEYDAFLAFYLTPDDDSAISHKERRAQAGPYEVPESGEETLFKFVRDYETTKIEQEVPNEFLLVFYDGDDEAAVFDDDRRRERGAYYKNIERKMHLKKKRANAYDRYEDKWEYIRVRHAPMSTEEEEERQEALAEVTDPMYLTMRAEADQDADGELDIDESTGLPVHGAV